MDRTRALAAVAFGALVMLASFALLFGPLNPCTNDATFEPPRMDASVEQDGDALVVRYEGSSTLTETSTVALDVTVGSTDGENASGRTIRWAAANGTRRASLSVHAGDTLRVTNHGAGEAVRVVWAGYETRPSYCPAERNAGPLTRVVASHVT